MSKQDHRIVTEKEIAEARQELFNLRFQNGLKQLLDTSSIRRQKKKIAQMLTVFNSKNEVQ